MDCVSGHNNSHSKAKETFRMTVLFNCEAFDDASSILLNVCVWHLTFFSLMRSVCCVCMGQYGDTLSLVVILLLRITGLRLIYSDVLL